jgi:hypothetical protein
MHLVPLPGVVPRFHSPAVRRLFTVPTGEDGMEPRKAVVSIATVSVEILTTHVSSSVEYHSRC